MSYGVTADGFVVKPLDVILADALGRARAAFADDANAAGAELDLGSTSVLRKFFEVACGQAAEDWKDLERQHYSGFLSTGEGAALDRLGEELGRVRQLGFAGGSVDLVLSGAQAGRSYDLPTGTPLALAGTPTPRFTTVGPISLSLAAPKGSVAVLAIDRGIAGNVPKATALEVPSTFAAESIFLGGATLAGSTSGPFAGGEVFESDADFRTRLLAFPRTVWTRDAILAAALEVDGVLDALVLDPQGGIDSSRSEFNTFLFDERNFDASRRPGEPASFGVVIAFEARRSWDDVAAQVRTAIDAVRPIGSLPELIPADHVEVGFRARVLMAPGRDAAALAADLLRRVRDALDTLRLGEAVRSAEVLATLANVAGVIDVQGFRLRRCPPVFGRIAFGDTPMQADDVEAGPGENLLLGPTEIGRFRVDGRLIDLEVVRS